MDFHCTVMHSTTIFPVSQGPKCKAGMQSSDFIKMQLVLNLNFASSESGTHKHMSSGCRLY